MSTIAAKTSKKPKGPYWYWTTLGPENVNLTDRTVDLPAGKYDLHYDFRGNPGNEFEFTLTDAGGAEVAKVADKIAPGEVDGWGKKAFVVS